MNYKYSESHLSAFEHYFYNETYDYQLVKYFLQKGAISARIVYHNICSYQKNISFEFLKLIVENDKQKNFAQNFNQICSELNLDLKKMKLFIENKADPNLIPVNKNYFLHSKFKPICFLFDNENLFNICPSVYYLIERTEFDKDTLQEIAHKIKERKREDLLPILLICLSSIPFLDSNYDYLKKSLSSMSDLFMDFETVGIWSPQRNYFFSPSFHRKIFSFLCSLKIVFGKKIPKFLLYSLIRKSTTK